MIYYVICFKFNEQFHNLIKATQSIADEQEVDRLNERELQGCKNIEEFLHFPLWTYELQDTQTKRVTKQKPIVSESVSESDFDNNATFKSYSYAFS